MNLLFYFARDPRLALAYVIALLGGALIMLGVMSLAAQSFLRDRNQQPQWRWFGWFALMKGLSAQVLLVAGSIDRSLSLEAFRALHLAFAAPAAMALIGFAHARGAPGLASLRPLWVASGLAIAWLLTGAVAGLEVLPFTFPWVLGLPAGICGAWALGRGKRGSEDTAGGRRALAACGVALAAVTLLDLCGPALSDRFQGWTFNTLRLYPSPSAVAYDDARESLAWLLSGRVARPGFDAGESPMLIVIGALLTWSMFFCWWAWAKSRAAGAGRASAAWRRLLWVLPASLLVIAAAGFSLLAVVNQQADLKLRQTLFARMKSSGLVIDPQLVTRALQGRSEAVDAARRELGQRLLTIHVHNPDFGRVYLWRFAAGAYEVIATPPGLAPERLRAPTDAAFERVAAAQPLYGRTMTREDGVVAVSFHVPLLVPGGREALCWLGAEVDAAEYQAGKRETMTVAVVAILLVTTVVILLLVYQMRHGVELELRSERDRAEESERIKTELLATLSHDVRTPLQSVLAYGGLLQNTTLDERQQGYVGALQEQARSLMRLLQNLLHISAAQLGFTPQREPFSVRRLADEAAGHVQPVATEKGLAFRLQVADSVPDRLLGDEVRVLQILLNLLTNAVKFTQRGAVTMSIAAEAHVACDGGANERGGGVGSVHWLVFRVRDTGPGLPTEAQAGLFELKPGKMGAKGRDGIGLGLPLVGKLCAVLGGSVAVQSRVGSGSEFTVRLPFAPADQLVANRAEPESVPRILRARPERALRRLLVVEDHAVVRAALTAMLEQMGFSVATAENAAEAIEWWRRECFDGALIDLGLPDQDGYALARGLREGATTRERAWFIALTAAHGEEARRAVSAAGFDRYLPKPAEAQALWEALTPSEAPSGRSFLAETKSATVKSELRNEAEKARAEIDTALARRDAKTGARFAHHLRNTALMLGDDELARCAQALEDALDDAWPDWDGAQRHCAEIGRAEIFRNEAAVRG